MKLKNLTAATAIFLMLATAAAAMAKPVKKAPVKPKALTIALSVTDEGFVPSNIQVRKGQAYNLVVTRKTDQTCAKQLLIPGYGVEKDLPLNVPVTIALVPKAAGEIGYSCGMGMIHGVLTVQ